MHNCAVSEELADLLASVDTSELGHRIRQARVTRGLTQAQLANGEVSIGYVSRIESGKRRPDLGLLERMAGRLKVPTLVLLAGVPDPTLTRLQVSLDHAELALRGGSPAEAEQHLAAIRSDLDACAMPELQRRAKHLRALTLEALGQLDDAIVELEDCLADESPEVTQSIRTAVALSRCYRESGDLARAIETGDRYLADLRRLHLDGSDEAIQLVVTVAAAHFERGDVAHAVRLCRRAIEQAEELGSPVAKASAYWNASIMESERGAVAAAVPLAAKALQLLESAEDNRNLARLRSQLGMFQLRLNPPELDDARANLEAAEAQFLWSSASPIDIGRNAVAIARAKLLSGDIDDAQDRAHAVLEQVRGTAPLLSVGALILLGQAAAARDDAAVAAKHYRDAVLELTRIGSDRGAAEAWFELGALLDELGLEREARDAYRSAAASTGLVSVYTSVRRDGLLRG
jgi:transcriptional regulator with XRE-family HTH domain